MPSEFLLAYQELVRLADDDPSDLASRAAEYPALRAACERMERAATGIWIADRYSSVRFAQHVSKAEVAAVADYQNRWQRAVLQTNPFLRDIASVASSPQLKSERDKIRDSLEDGELLARRFEALIDFAREHASPDDESNFWEWAYEAISVWDDLRLRGDFRLASTLAALELLPFVRIPEELSDKHGSAETISLFTKLRDAQARSCTVVTFHAPPCSERFWKTCSHPRNLTESRFPRGLMLRNSTCRCASDSKK